MKKYLYDTIIIGAGASGLMVASNINKKTLIIEKNTEIGKKLKITGGGRGNVTNNYSHNQFLNHINNSNFYKTAHKKFSNHDLLKYFNKKGIKTRIEGNKVFLDSNNTKSLIGFFSDEVKSNKNVELKLGEEVTSVLKKECFIVLTRKGEYRANKVVVCTGGMSYPDTGSTGFGYEIAKKFGHEITELYSGENRVKTIQKVGSPGQTIDVKVSFGDIEEKGSLLFTHDGLSGEPIMNISDKIERKILLEGTTNIYIDFLPNKDNDYLEKLIDNNEGEKVEEIFKNIINKKILCNILKDFYDSKAGELSRKSRKAIVHNLKKYKVDVTKVYPLQTAIVTSGGIDLDYICSNSFQSNIVKGLYFGGETLDLHGNVGGFNLTIAFCSGYIIAQDINNNEF